MFLRILLFLSALCVSGFGAEKLTKWERKTISHWIESSEHLLVHRPSAALDSLYKAYEIAISHKHSSPLLFLIYFDYAIAYDLLHDKRAYQESIEHLVKTMTSSGKKKPHSSAFSKQADLESLELLKNLALAAESQRAQTALLAIVQRMAYEINPCKENAQTEMEWQTALDPDSTTLYRTCNKSFWKKFTRWCREVVVFLGIIAEASKHIKTIHDQWSTQPSQ